MGEFDENRIMKMIGGEAPTPKGKIKSKAVPKQEVKNKPNEESAFDFKETFLQRVELTDRQPVATTDSRHNYPVAPNIRNREFTATRPGQVWVSDITYIKTNKGWLYLTVIIDLFDRKVVGWSMSKGMTAEETIIAAWRMAVNNRPINQELIFYSDRGVQYACTKFTNILNANKLVQRSMSRKGNCWDNAVAESFFKTIKVESPVFRTF